MNDDKIKIDITERQKGLLIDYVCDGEITEWVESGKKMANNKYRISVAYCQVEEMISALLFLAPKAESRTTKKELMQLADYLEQFMVEEL